MASHRSDRDDVSLLVCDHVGQDVANSVQVRDSVNMHGALNHGVLELKSLMTTDDARVVDEHCDCTELSLSIVDSFCD